MTSPAREKFSSQVRPDLLASLRGLAASEGRQVQFLLEEAITDLVQKRTQQNPRSTVLAAYLGSHDKFSGLYQKLAK